MKRLLNGTVSLIAVLFIFAACSKEAQKPVSGVSPQTNYYAKGIIKELRADGRTVVIAHEKIGDYMDAMTMPFEVKNTNDLAQVRTNDSVTFRLVVTRDDGWIDQIKRVQPHLTPIEASPARAEIRRVRYVEPLEIGSPVPGYTFTNELAAPVKLTDYKGSALVITFIYTRCPYPLFCPRMTGNFAQAIHELQSSETAPTNWHFVSISFDVEHDTPETLLRYARSNRADPKVWSFLTGALIDVDAITEQFGLTFPRGETGFDHNLRTAVIDATGRVQKIFPGNTWPVSELVSNIIKAAGSAGK